MSRTACRLLAEVPRTIRGSFATVAFGLNDNLLIVEHGAMDLVRGGHELATSLARASDATSQRKGRRMKEQGILL